MASLNGTNGSSSRDGSPILNATKSDPLNPSTSVGEIRNYHVLLAIEALLSGIALIICIVTIQWLIRIKRAFRHELLLLLMITDILKCIAYFILPIVVWSGTAVTSQSRYCQFSGWLMAWVCEASDYLMLIIAIHTVLSIFKPAKRPGKGGLVDYWRVIYFGWVFFPILMSSLPFINPNGGYASLGIMCYMPVEPMWYRLALAWIPRYLVFIIIMGAYTAIYAYVHYKFKGFGDVQYSGSSGAYLLSTQDTQDFLRSGTENHSVHGENTLPDLDLGHHGAPEDPERNAMPDIPTYQGQGNLETRGSTTQQHDITGRYLSTPSANVVQFSPQISPSHINRDGYFDAPPTTTEASTPGSRPFSKGQGSKGWDEIGGRVIRRPRRQMTDIDRTRVAIKRQLRFLFIYPLVYLLSWIPASIVHFMQYRDPYHTRYWIMVLLVLTLPFQGGFDAIIILSREKPWRPRKQPLPTWMYKIFRWDTSRSQPTSSVEESHTTSGTGTTRSNSVNWWEKEDHTGEIDDEEQV